MATHVATGSAVMPPPGEGVERLLAGHAVAHLIVPDPTRRTLAKLLFLTKTAKVGRLKTLWVTSDSWSWCDPAYRFLHTKILRSQPEGFMFLLELCYGVLNDLQRRIYFTKKKPQKLRKHVA